MEIRMEKKMEAIQNKLMNRERLSVREINHIGREGLRGNARAIFLTALYYLLEEDDENAFDILLDEFLESANEDEVKEAMRSLRLVRKGVARA